jgi:hypothetical protein
LNPSKNLGCVTFGQNGQRGFTQIKHLLKMANIIIVKWGILPTYLPYSTTFLPTYLPTYLLQPTNFHIYLFITTYWPTYLVTYYNIFTYLLAYRHTHPTTCINYYLSFT